MDGIGSGSCSMVGFVINSVGPMGSAFWVVVNNYIPQINQTGSQMAMFSQRPENYFYKSYNLSSNITLCLSLPDIMITMA